MERSSLRILGLAMIITSFVCGIIGLLFAYQFKSYSGSRVRSQMSRFLIVRKPKIILLYCSCSLFMLLISSPCQLSYHILGHEWHINMHDYVFWMWLNDFIQDLCITFMLVVIAARCWLLYYDRLHSISLVDKTWKGAINATEQDFWLRHRKTWGDSGFITCVGFVVVTAVCIILSVVSIFALQYEWVILLHITTFALVVLPTCALIFFIVCSKKLKKLSLYDEYQIVQEIQYLSLSTVLIIVASIMSIIPVPELQVFVKIGEILFAITTTYIQTGWAIKQLRQQSIRLRHKKRILKGPKSKISYLAMSDVLKHKDGFEMFMRHCQREFNVEGLLFIVEVAQFKAKLYENIQTIAHVVKGIQEVEMSRATLTVATVPATPSEEYKSDLPKLIDRVSSKRRNSYSDSGSCSADIPHSPLPGLQQIVSYTATIRKSCQMDGFEDIVLEREWVPISRQIFKPRKRRNSDFVRLSTELKLAVIHADYKEPETITDEIKLELEKLEIMEMQASDDNMYYHAQHLFLKYIDTESEFTINISHSAREGLLLFFSETKAKGFDAVLQLNEISRDKIVFNKSDQLIKSLVLKEFLYLLFDSALGETWKLLSRDSYVRFMQTKEYKHLAPLIKQKRKRTT